MKKKWLELLCSLAVSLGTGGLAGSLAASLAAGSMADIPVRITGEKVCAEMVSCAVGGQCCLAGPVFPGRGILGGIFLAAPAVVSCI